MAKVYIYNTSLSNLRTVAQIAFPATLTDLSNKSLYNGNDKIPLIWEKNVGDISKIYTALASFPPGESVWEVIDDTYETPVFRFSDWVAKDPIGSILKTKIGVLGNEIIPSLNSSSRFLRNNGNSTTFEIVHGVVNGFKVHQFLDVYSGLDHVRFQYAVNWADQSNPSYTRDTVKFTITCKDEFVINYAGQMGIPLPSYNPLIDEWYVEIQIPSQQIRDGQGLELRGYILTHPETFIGVIGPMNEVRLGNLAAVKNGDLKYGGVGQVRGSYENMNLNGNWFWKYLPSHIPEEPLVDIFATRNPFSLRMIGMSNTPGQTGDQEDFGADKGHEATVLHHNWWQTYIEGALVDRMRTFNIHEPNGAKVSGRFHPNRVTWNMETFDPLTQDTLGKAKNQWRFDGTGFVSYDNQHKSMNNFFTYLALTGDDLAMDTLVGALEADLQQARNLDLAEREIGRTFACWYKMTRLLDPTNVSRLKQFMLLKYSEVKHDWRGRFFADPQHSVRCLQVIQDPRSGAVNPETGKVELSWIPYQTAEMLKGLYAFWLTFQQPDTMELMKSIATTYVNHGVANINNSWYPLTFSRYRTGLGSGQPLDPLAAAPEEGLPLDPSAYTLSSWQIKIGEWGFWEWTAPALSLAAGPILPDLDPTVKQRAREILQSVYPDHMLMTKRELQWFMTEI